MKTDSYHHGDLRNALIETGIKIINETGTANFSLRKVAAECGVSNNAPYSHFKSKDELIEAMTEHITKQLTEKLLDDEKASIDSETGMSIGKMGVRYVEFFIDNPHYFKFLFSGSAIKFTLSLEGNKNDYPPYRLFAEKSIIAMRNEGVPEERLLDEIISMWALVHGIASIATMDGVSCNFDWKDKIEDIMKCGVTK